MVRPEQKLWTETMPTRRLCQSLQPRELIISKARLLCWEIAWIPQLESTLRQLN